MATSVPKSIPLKTLLVSICAAAAIFIIWSSGCLGGRRTLPIGALCASSDECASGAVCIYGRCRSPCTYDRDCPPGQICIASGDGGLRVCTLEGDWTCGGEQWPCPPVLDCSPFPCLEVCNDESDCTEERECIDSRCISTDDDGDRDADVGPVDADIDVGSDADQYDVQTDEDAPYDSYDGNEDHDADLGPVDADLSSDGDDAGHDAHEDVDTLRDGDAPDGSLLTVRDCGGHQCEIDEACCIDERDLIILCTTSLSCALPVYCLTPSDCAEPRVCCETSTGNLCTPPGECDRAFVICVDSLDCPTPNEGEAVCCDLGVSVPYYTCGYGVTCS